MPTDYLIHFAQTHAEFRVPELVSISELCGFEITFPDDPDLKDSNRPFMVINLECEEHARQLARRCILIKSDSHFTWAPSIRADNLLPRHVYKFWGRGNSYDELHASNKARQSAWERYKEATSFRFIVDAFQHSIPGQRQREVVESFRYMAFTGPVVLSDKADITLGVWEECKTRVTAEYILLC
jgi:tRNA (guanine10-N2)-methyltransferase